MLAKEMQALVGNVRLERGGRDGLVRVQVDEEREEGESRLSSAAKAIKFWRVPDSAGAPDADCWLMCMA